MILNVSWVCRSYIWDAFSFDRYQQQQIRDRIGLPSRDRIPLLNPRVADRKGVGGEEVEELEGKGGEN